MMKSIAQYIKRINNSQTAKMWFVSYMMILLVPIIFSFISYYYVENSLVKKINETNAGALMSAQTYTDNILNGIVSATVNLSSNTQIKSLAATSELPTSTQMYQRNISLSDSNYVWRAHSLFSDYITKKYIYLPNTDTIYTGSILVDKNYFFEKEYYDFDGFDSQTWYTALLQCDRPDFVSIPCNNSTELFFVYPTYANKAEAQFYTIVHININAIAKNASGSNSEHFFVQHNNNIFSTTAPSVKISNAITETLDISNGTKQTDTTIIKSSSDSSDLIYGLAIPTSQYRAEIDRSRLFMWISNFICILFALIIILYLISKNNRPLENIARTLGSNEQEEQYTDAYKYINEAISKSLSEKNQYADKLFKQHDILKENILTSMLYGKPNDKFSYTELLSMVNIDMPHNMFATIALCPGDLTDMFNDDKYHASDSEKHKMAQFIICNIINEALGELYTTETVVISSMIIAIINYPSESADKVNSNVSRILTDAAELIKGEFNFDTYAAISNHHIDISKLNDAYSESVLCMEYALNSSNKILFFDEISSGEEVTTIYSSEIENDIAHYLETGDNIKCKKIIENYIYNFQLNKNISVEMARAFSYDLLSTFFRHLISTTSDRSRQFLAGVELDSIMSAGKTASSIMLKTITTIEKYLDSNQSENIGESTTQKNDFYQKIKTYIDENYSNTELTVSELAVLFKTNSSYLSSQFKKEFDIGLSEYITSVRIESAKKMLITTNMPNTEISLLAGYSNTRTFLRAFSKAEGITPKEYRRLNNPAV